MAEPLYDDPDFNAHLRDGRRLKDRALEELARALRSGRMCAFTGSYLNLELGYEGWNQFLAKGIDLKKLEKDERFRDSTFAQELVKQLKKDETDALSLVHYELLIEWLRANGMSDLIQIAEGKQLRSIKPRASKKGTYQPNSASQIVEKLGIRRIITLNYDFEHELASLTGAHELTRPPQEAEELLLKRGRLTRENLGPSSVSRVPDSSHRLELHAADGSLMISDCFSRERTDRLFEFATGSSHVDRHILHLHGRQDVPQSIVVTYSHYEALYRRSSLTKLPFEFAMRTLFAGNPTLFVGVGLTEDEILFHLRQFVSDGPHSRLVPHFIIWSADSKNVNPRTKGRIDPWEEIRRLRWYRQYGVYTIYDVELDAFEAADDITPEKRLFKSLELIARAGAKAMGNFGWERKDFRSVARHLEAVDAQGHVSLWGPDEQDALPLPDWELAEQVHEQSIDFEDRLTKAVDFGRPIKAFLDPPGSGHGYVARLLRELIVQRNRTRGNFPEFRVFQINAGFAWEIDSTFELISGSFDGKSAFAGEKSRRQALDDFLQNEEVWHGFQKALEGLGPDNEKKVALIINGADRYFDPNGYPLSAELDNLIRTLAKPFCELRDVFERIAVPNPVSLFLFGTARIARYLSSLGLIDQRDQRLGLVDIYGTLPAPFKSGTTALENASLTGQLNQNTRFRLSGGSQSLSKDDLQALPIRHPNGIALGPAQTDSEKAPSGAGEFKSAYLRFAEGRFRQRLRRHDKNYFLPGMSRSLLDRYRHGRPSEQREKFVDAYLQPSVLWRCFWHKGSTDRVSAGLRAELAMAILRSMAFVGQPVEVSTLAAVPAVQEWLRKSALEPCSSHDSGANCICALSEFMDDLRDLALVVRMERFPGSKDEDAPIDQQVGERYGLHRALLHEIRDRHTLPISDARTYTSFNIPLFAAQPIDEAEPNQEVYDELQQLVDGLVVTPDDPLFTAGPVHGARLRAAMASIRSYYTTSVLLMHEPEPAPSEVRSARLTEHARMIEKLIRAFEHNAELRRSLDKTEPWLINQPRYAFPDDIVWLQDQRGVALLSQGDLYEARHAFREARRINKQFVEYEDHYQNWRRLELNELHVDIERGKLGVAHDKLRLLEEAVNAQCDAVAWSSSETFDAAARQHGTAFEAIVIRYGHELRDRIRVADPVFPADAILTTGLLCGYRGWCNYMAGRLQAADRNFRHCVNILHNLGEQRANALFLRLHASLQRAQGDYEAAQANLDLSLKLSVSGQQMDLSHHCWIMQCEIELERDPAASRSELLHRLTNSLRYAILTDMHRLRMEARRALARLRLGSGDYDGAMEHATDALAVAIRCGFSLRKINLRALIGEILVRRGDPISGRAMLDQAALEADRIGYQRAVDQVHQTRTMLDLKH